MHRLRMQTENKADTNYRKLAEMFPNAVTETIDENGNVEMRETLDLGITIDERLADGYYYSKSIRLLKHLLENPELLERPVNEEVEY